MPVLTITIPPNFLTAMNKFMADVQRFQVQAQSSLQAAQQVQIHLPSQASQTHVLGRFLRFIQTLEKFSASMERTIGTIISAMGNFGKTFMRGLAVSAELGPLGWTIGAIALTGVAVVGAVAISASFGKWLFGKMVDLGDSLFKDFLLSAGIGTTFGSLRAFRTAFGGLPNDPMLFSRFLSGRVNVESKQFLALQTLGIQNFRNTADVMANATLAAARFLRQFPKNSRLRMAEAFGFMTLFSPEYLIAITEMKDTELEEMARKYEANKSELELTDKAVESWKNFTLQIEVFWAKIQSVIGEKLADPDADFPKSIKNLSQAVGDFLNRIMQTEFTKKAIDIIVDKLKSFHEFLSTPDAPEKWINDVFKEVKEIITLLEKIKEEIKKFVKIFSPINVAEAAEVKRLVDDLRESVEKDPRVPPDFKGPKTRFPLTVPPTAPTGPEPRARPPAAPATPPSTSKSPKPAPTPPSTRAPAPAPAPTTPQPKVAQPKTRAQPAQPPAPQPKTSSAPSNKQPPAYRIPQASKARPWHRTGPPPQPQPSNAPINPPTRTRIIPTRQQAVSTTGVEPTRTRVIPTRQQAVSTAQVEPTKTRVIPVRHAPVVEPRKTQVAPIATYPGVQPTRTRIIPTRQNPSSAPSNQPIPSYPTAPTRTHVAPIGTYPGVEPRRTQVSPIRTTPVQPTRTQVSPIGTYPEVEPRRTQVAPITTYPGVEPRRTQTFSIQQNPSSAPSNQPLPPKPAEPPKPSGPWVPPWQDRTPSNLPSWYSGQPGYPTPRVPAAPTPPATPTAPTRPSISSNPKPQSSNTRTITDPAVAYPTPTAQPVYNSGGQPGPAVDKTPGRPGDGKLRASAGTPGSVMKQASSREGKAAVPSPGGFDPKGQDNLPTRDRNYGGYRPPGVNYVTAEQAGIKPVFPVNENVNWQFMKAESIARMNEAYSKLTPQEKRQVVMNSGYRPAYKNQSVDLAMSPLTSQESVWNRHLHKDPAQPDFDSPGAAAKPAGSRHGEGEAGDFTNRAGRDLMITGSGRANNGRPLLGPVNPGNPNFDPPHAQPVEGRRQEQLGPATKRELLRLSPSYTDESGMALSPEDIEKINTNEKRSDLPIPAGEFLVKQAQARERGESGLANAPGTRVAGDIVPSQDTQPPQQTGNQPSPPKTPLPVIKGKASFYDPRDPNDKTAGGMKLSTGGTYNANEPEAAIQTGYRGSFGGLTPKSGPGYALVKIGDKTAIVRVNDVGPLKPGRVMDLNAKSREMFGVTKDQGLADAEVYVLPRGRSYKPGEISKENFEKARGGDLSQFPLTQNKPQEIGQQGARPPQVRYDPISSTHYIRGLEARSSVTRDGRHQGIDLAAPKGTPVYAVKDGVVTRVSTDDWGQPMVTIKHNDGTYTRDMHLMPGSLPKVGTRVKGGQPYARSGEANGVQHLHHEEWRGDPRNGGTLLDPLKEMNYNPKFDTLVGGQPRINGVPQKIPTPTTELPPGLDPSGNQFSYPNAPGIYGPSDPIVPGDPKDFDEKRQPIQNLFPHQEKQIPSQEKLDQLNVKNFNNWDDYMEHWKKTPYKVNNLSDHDVVHTKDDKAKAESDPPPSSHDDDTSKGDSGGSDDMSNWVSPY